MRVSQGGHDVPSAKLLARFPRTPVNLRTALRELPEVRIYDNDDLRTPFRQIAVFQNGQAMSVNPPVPRWLEPLSHLVQRVNSTAVFACQRSSDLRSPAGNNRRSR